MKLKDLYIANAERRYSAVKKIIKENITLETKPLTKARDYIVAILLVLTIVIAFLMVGFNIKYFLISFALIFGFFLLFIFGNKAKIQCDKNTLNINQGFQRLNIPYKNLRNVYIGRVSGLFFFLPAFNYNLVIRYEDNFSFLRELEFSLLCANEKEVEAFINNFEIEQKIEERYIQYEKKKNIRKILGVIFSIVLFILVALYVIPRVS